MSKMLWWRWSVSIVPCWQSRLESDKANYQCKSVNRSGKLTKDAPVTVVGTRSIILIITEIHHITQSVDLFLFDLFIYSPKKVTHNIFVYRQVQIIVAVTCVLYKRYVIEYKEYNFEGFW